MTDFLQGLQFWHWWLLAVALLILEVFSPGVFALWLGLAAGLTNPQDGLGAVGGYAALKNYTQLGGQLTVFSLP